MTTVCSDFPMIAIVLLIHNGIVLMLVPNSPHAVWAWGVRLHVL